MGFVPGVPELLIIVLIVVMLFGVGKLPEVFGAVGKGIKEFRKEAGDVASLSKSVTTELPAAPVAPAASAATTVAPVSENNVDATVKLPQ